MSQLNDKARRILDYITKEIGDGVPPSVREICTGLDIKSTGTVCNCMQKLFARKVFVTENPGNARAFRIVK